MEKLLPIEIPVIVCGKAMRAMVFQRVGDRRTSRFQVRFDNGYEDVFWLAGEDSDLGPIGTRKSSEYYAPSLLNDLRVIDVLGDYQLAKTFSHIIGEKPTNVWIVEDKDEDMGVTFGIYYHGICRFTVKPDKDGQVEVENIYDADTEVIDELMSPISALLSVPKSKKQQS